MEKIITIKQKEEIGSLASEHKDAIVAFGTQMYIDGIINGAGSILLVYAVSSFLANLYRRHLDFLDKN